MNNMHSFMLSAPRYYSLFVSKSPVTFDSSRVFVKGALCNFDCTKA